MKHQGKYFISGSRNEEEIFLHHAFKNPVKSKNHINLRFSFDLWVKYFKILIS